MISWIKKNPILFISIIVGIIIFLISYFTGNWLLNGITLLFSSIMKLINKGKKTSKEENEIKQKEFDDKIKKSKENQKQTEEKIKTINGVVDQILEKIKEIKNKDLSDKEIDDYINNL